MTEHPTGKPLPQPFNDSKTYWQGCQRHELLIPRCLNCGKYFFYPRQFCPTCMSPSLEWVKSGGLGRVYSFSVVYTPFGDAYGPEDVPYIVAIIELKEGVRLMSNIVDCRPEEVRVDMPVEVVFDDVTSEVTLPKFRPATPGRPGR